MVKQKTVKAGKYAFSMKGIAMLMSSDWPIITRFVIIDLLAAKIWASVFSSESELLIGELTEFALPDFFSSWVWVSKLLSLFALCLTSTKTGICGWEIWFGSTRIKSISTWLLFSVLFILSQWSETVPLSVHMQLTETWKLFLISWFWFWMLSSHSSLAEVFCISDLLVPW